MGGGGSLKINRKLRIPLIDTHQKYSRLNYKNYFFLLQLWNIIMYKKTTIILLSSVFQYIVFMTNY